MLYSCSKGLGNAVKFGLVSTFFSISLFIVAYNFYSKRRGNGTTQAIVTSGCTAQKVISPLFLPQPVQKQQ